MGTASTQFGCEDVEKHLLLCGSRTCALSLDLASNTYAFSMFLDEPCLTLSAMPLFCCVLYVQEEVELSRRGGGAEQTPDVVRIG